MRFNVNMAIDGDNSDDPLKCETDRLSYFSDKLEAGLRDGVQDIVLKVMKWLVSICKMLEDMFGVNI